MKKSILLAAFAVAIALSSAVSVSAQTTPAPAPKKEEPKVVKKTETKRTVVTKKKTYRRTVKKPAQS